MARRALSGGLAALFALGSLTLALPNQAAAAALAPPRPGVALILIEDRVSFDALMAVPQFQALARAGGAGLMATNQSYRDDMHDVYLALGSGAAPGTAVAQLLGLTLRRYGIGVCGIDSATSDLPDPTSPVLLLTLPASQNCLGLSGTSSALLVGIDTPLLQLDDGSPRMIPAAVADRRRALLAQAGAGLSGPGNGSGRTLIMVLSASPSRDMNRAGDEVTPIVMAQGPFDQLVPSAGSLHGLTSDTTRQDGLVSNVDVAPTILAFFGIPIPSAMDGSVIRTTDDPAPFALYRLEREQRRVRLPIQLAVVLFLAAAAMVATVALIVLARRGSLPEPFLGGLRFLVLCCAALPISLIAGGLLPRRTYLVVVPFVVGLTLLLALEARRVGEDDPLRSLTALGAVGLAFIVVDAAFGGHAFRAPLFGGIMFDGVRYFGLGNAFIPTLVASGVFVAWRRERTTAVAVLFGVGLVAGFPHLVARRGRVDHDVRRGGAVVDARAAATSNANEWRTWSRAAMRSVLPWSRGWGRAAGQPVRARVSDARDAVRRTDTRAVGHGDPRGLAPVGHRGRPGPSLSGRAAATHRASRSALARGSWAWADRRGLRTVDDRWRDVLVVLVLSAVVAFVANDTGLSASAPAFVYALAVLACPRSRRPPGRCGLRRERARRAGPVRGRRTDVRPRPEHPLRPARVILTRG